MRQIPEPAVSRIGAVGRLPVTVFDRGGDEPASAHTGETGLPHQTRHPLASYISTLGRELGVNARRTIYTVRGSVRRTDLRDQCIVRLGPPRRAPLQPCIVATGGDTQQLAQGDDRVIRGCRFAAFPSGGSLRDGDRSRTGTLRRDRVRLPSEPGRRL